MKNLKGVLVFPVINGEVLLARKARGIGAGMWNGYGGNFDPEEDKDFATCAIREFNEECRAGVEESDLEDRGVVTFHKGDSFVFEVHIFVANKIGGTPQPSDEMVEPTWFSFDDLPPKEQFMESDLYWLPLVLFGKRVLADVWYDENFCLTKIDFQNAGLV